MKNRLSCLLSASLCEFKSLKLTLSLALNHLTAHILIASNFRTRNVSVYNLSASRSSFASSVTSLISQSLRKEEMRWNERLNKLNDNGRMECLLSFMWKWYGEKFMEKYEEFNKSNTFHSLDFIDKPSELEQRHRVENWALYYAWDEDEHFVMQKRWVRAKRRETSCLLASTIYVGKHNHIHHYST